MGAFGGRMPYCFCRAAKVCSSETMGSEGLGSIPLEPGDLEN